MSHIKIQLKKFLEPYACAFVCFSGGLDSCLLLKEVHDIMGERVDAITFTSPLQTRKNIKDAEILADKLGITHSIIDYNPLTEEIIRTNKRERCYLCKTRMFSIAYGLASGKRKSTVILDGTHMGDDPLSRPGMRAGKEFGIRSPWRELGYGKEEIRNLARDEGLYLWDRSSDSCLATRFPRDYTLTVEALGKLEMAEEVLRGFGLKDFRLRPADSPPGLILSEEDYSIVQALGLKKICNSIMIETGWHLENCSVFLTQPGRT
ncbi:MAG: 7-cyano-7-deazaguanine synthase [bacterium]